MVDLKQSSDTKVTRKFERGNTMIAALVVLLVVAAGAVAYLATQMDDKAPAAGTEAPQEMAAAPASDEEASGESETAQADPASQPVIKPGNPVVAKIDGKEVKRLDVFQFIQGLGPQAQQTPIDQLFPLAVDQVVNAEIIGKKVSGANLDNDPAVKAQLEAAKAQIVRGVFMQKAVDRAMTDERLKVAYDQYVEAFPEIPERKTRHILVKEEDQAKELLKQIKGGADFAELAKENSVDATKESGGELDYISKQDQVIPEYIEEAFDLKVGEMSKKPLKSDFGYHIVEVLDERNRPPATFEEAKPFLAAQLRGQVLNEVLASWREDADVEVYDINGDSIEPAAGNETPAEAAPAAEEPAAQEPVEAEPATEAPAKAE